jgi:hypothetical protein
MISGDRRGENENGKFTSSDLSCVCDMSPPLATHLHVAKHPILLKEVKRRAQTNEEDFGTLFSERRQP